MRGSIAKYSVVVTDTYFFYFNASDIFFISSVDMVMGFPYSWVKTRCANNGRTYRRERERERERERGYRSIGTP